MGCILRFFLFFTFFFTNFFSYIFPSFGMDCLNEPLSESQGVCGILVKDLRVSPTRARSDIYEYTQYPTMPMVHSYHHDAVETPFSATFPKAHVGKDFKNILSTHFPNAALTISFVVQGVETFQPGEQKDLFYSLKPQYFMEPESPARSQETIERPVLWRAIPGMEGNIKSTAQNAESLLKDSVSIHPTSAKDDRLILSGDVMHLKEIDPEKSGDFFSLVAFQKGGGTTVGVTYHWLLNPSDLTLFKDALTRSNNVNELLFHLDMYSGDRTFESLLLGLKRYVGLENIGKYEESIGEEFAGSMSTASTILHLKLTGNATPLRGIGDFLFVQQGNLSSWNRLHPDTQTRIWDEIVKMTSSQAYEKVVPQDLVSQILALQSSGNQASVEEIGEFLLRQRNPETWDRLGEELQKSILEKLKLETSLTVFQPVLKEISAQIRTLRSNGNQASIREIAEFLLTERYKGLWSSLDGAIKKEVLTNLYQSM